MEACLQSDTIPIHYSILGFMLNVRDGIILECMFTSASIIFSPPDGYNGGGELGYVTADLP